MDYLEFCWLFSAFKELCAEGRRPGTFKEYCVGYGVTRMQIHSYMKADGLWAAHGFRGIANPNGWKSLFEDVIFKETGFQPADGGVITVI